MISYRILRIWVYLLAITCIPFTAFSDDLFELSLMDLQDIRVEVASLFEDSNLDVASSTATVSRNDWQDKGALTLGHALESVPSVFSNFTLGGTEAIAIRGFATELSVRGIAYSLDGVPMGSYAYASPGYTLPRAPLNLFNNIEVIRGPGSTLYGNDAFHGVIAMELYNKSTDNTEIYLQTGSPELNEASVVNSFNSGKLHIHSGINTTEDGGHDLDLTYTDINSGITKQSNRDQNFQNDSAFVKIRYGQISDKKGQFGLTVFHNQFTSSEFQGLGSQFYKNIASIFDIESTSLAGATEFGAEKTQLNMINLTHEILLTNNIQVKNQYFEWHGEHEWGFDHTNYPTSLTAPANSPLNNTASDIRLNCKVNESDSGINPLYCPHTLFQGENENRQGYYLQVKQAENIYDTQWVIELGYDKNEISSGRYERINTSGETINLETLGFIGKQRTLHHFLAQARTSFLDDKYLLTYGARYDDYSDGSNHTSPRLGLVYKTNSQWTQKLLFGHAYRAPTAAEKFSTGVAVGDPDIDPETIETFEYINIYQTSHYQLESVIFYSNWNNAIALVKKDPSDTFNTYQNSAKNHSHGLEVNLRSHIAHTKIEGSLSFVESENITNDIDYVAFPSWITNFNIEHPILINTLNLGLRQRIMLSYQLDDQEADSDSATYYRTDLYLKWIKSKHLSGTLNIQNAFDQDNKLPSYYGSEGGLRDFGRIIKANIKYKF
jgi:outer membrane receptor protein involved in Fe transport